MSEQDRVKPLDEGQRAALLEIIRVTVDFGFDVGRDSDLPKAMVVEEAVAMARRMINAAPASSAAGGADGGAGS